MSFNSFKNSMNPSLFFTAPENHLPNEDDKIVAYKLRNPFKSKALDILDIIMLANQHEFARLAIPTADIESEIPITDRVILQSLHRELFFLQSARTKLVASIMETLPPAQLKNIGIPKGGCSVDAIKFNKQQSQQGSIPEYRVDKITNILLSTQSLTAGTFSLRVLESFATLLHQVKMRRLSKNQLFGIAGKKAIFLKDANIPLPDKTTALAWAHICGVTWGTLTRRDSFILPHIVATGTVGGSSFNTDPNVEHGLSVKAKAYPIRPDGTRWHGVAKIYGSYKGEITEGKELIDSQITIGNAAIFEKRTMINNRFEFFGMLLNPYQNEPTLLSYCWQNDSRALINLGLRALSKWYKVHFAFESEVSARHWANAMAIALDHVNNGTPQSRMHDSIDGKLSEIIQYKQTKKSSALINDMTQI